MKPITYRVPYAGIKIPEKYVSETNPTRNLFIASYSATGRRPPAGFGMAPPGSHIFAAGPPRLSSPANPPSSSAPSKARSKAHAKSNRLRTRRKRAAAHPRGHRGGGSAPADMAAAAVTVSSAGSLLAMLQEPAPELKLHALACLNSLVHAFWHEISTSVSSM